MQKGKKKEETPDIEPSPKKGKSRGKRDERAKAMKKWASHNSAQKPKKLQILRGGRGKEGWSQVEEGEGRGAL